jgi:hypothetical protein
MTARLFRKKPVTIEAVQYDGSTSHAVAIARWIEGGDYVYDGGTRDYGPMFIPTLEGRMEASPGDWIIKGVVGEFYPCKPDIFGATHEPVLP